MVSRRNFLKTAGVAAVALAVENPVHAIGAVSSHAPAKGRKSGEKVNVALIGSLFSSKTLGSCHGSILAFFWAFPGRAIDIAARMIAIFLI